MESAPLEPSTIVQMSDNNQSSSSQPASEPAIYKLVNPKTASYLRTTAAAREESAKAAEMANEQT